MPREIVSAFAASARTAARIGPIHGVHPKANAKPSRKPLVTPESAPPDFALSSVCAPRLWKRTSRLSPRVSDGPARKMSATESNCTEPNIPPGPMVSVPKRRQRIAAPNASTPPITSPAVTGNLISHPTRCNPNRIMTAPAPRHGSHQRLMLQQKLAHHTCRSPEADEHDRESGDKRQRRGKQAVARRLARAKLLDTDP